ncbi:hypothetical protein U8C31_18365 [Sinorhizobium medicae]|uniref:hypothetical protein n=1 Tax=Sinorhizobium medicae TaxID=110321 RepID=UPI002AF6C1AB|nr:hypothetical protein [Sinorhizobium medicae]WQO72200.1 hypothetical protein U8C31_18365 [Sinorhizobium medicae]
MDVSKLMAALEAQGILVNVQFFPPNQPCDPQAFVDAATDAVEQINDGRSRLVASFQDVAVKGRISETLI